MCDGREEGGKTVEWMGNGKEIKSSCVTYLLYSIASGAAL